MCKYVVEYIIKENKEMVELEIKEVLYGKEIENKLDSKAGVRFEVNGKWIEFKFDYSGNVVARTDIGSTMLISPCSGNVMEFKLG